jgi:hypothetical protein
VYRHSDIEQVVLDTLTAWYNECVEAFRTATVQAFIDELTSELIKNRVLYTKDIAVVVSKYPSLGLIAKP